jgi:hypothetical protein
MLITPGATSQSVTVQILDDTGLGVTGLVAATFPPTYYKKAGASAAVQITLSDLATITTPYASGGVKETAVGGYYRLDLPNAAIDTTSRVTLMIAPVLDVRDVASVNPDNAGISAIKAKTDNLPADPASTTDVNAARDAVLAEGGPGPWTTGSGGSSGDGDTAVNHNTGGEDNLRYVDDGGFGIDNARIVAFLKSDFEAGALVERARAITRSDGRWVAPMMLNSGLTYTLLFEKPGLFGPDAKEVTV